MNFVSYRLKNISGCYSSNRISIIKEYRNMTGKSLKEAVDVFPSDGHFEDGQVITVEQQYPPPACQSLNFFTICTPSSVEPEETTKDLLKELLRHCTDHEQYDIAADILRILKNYF